MLRLRFKSAIGSSRGKAQWVEHSTDNREAAGSIQASRTSFDAEKMSWRTRRSHKPPLGGFDSHLRNHVVQREDCWSAPVEESSILSVSTSFACVAEMTSAGLKNRTRRFERSRRRHMRRAAGVRFAHPL